MVASLLDHFYKDELDVSKYQNISSGGRNERGPREQRSEDNGFTRLFIARGRKDGLDKRRLVDYLIEQVGAEDRDIQNVTVRDDFSFVSAPLQVAERILQTFSSVGAEGRPIITRAKPDNPNGKHLSGRRGDRYDDRPSSSDRRRLVEAMMTSSRMAGTPMVVVMTIAPVQVSRMIGQAARMENTVPLKGKKVLALKSGTETNKIHPLVLSSGCFTCSPMLYW